MTNTTADDICIKSTDSVYDMWNDNTTYNGFVTYISDLSYNNWYKEKYIDCNTSEYVVDCPGIDPKTISLNLYQNVLSVKFGEFEYYLCLPVNKIEHVEIKDPHYKWGQLIFRIKKVTEEGKNIPIRVFE